MTTALERMEVLDQVRYELVLQRRISAENVDAEAVARVQLQIEAVDRAIEDERLLGDDAPEAAGEFQLPPKAAG